MIVREAERADAPAIEALYRSFVSNPAIRVAPEHVEAIRGDAMNLLLVAEDAAHVVGTAQMTMCMDAMFGSAPYAVVENIVVAADARGRGIGRSLLARIDELARSAACTKIMLLSSIERADAHRFFVRVGFDDRRKQGFVKYLGYPPRPIPE
jgi:N-acetylglutamate synthase-like GNAT family acetyltransferase